VTGPATTVAPRLSALRLVSFVPHARDAVHVGLLTPDAQQVVDLTHLGITDALEAIEQLDMLRQTAGAIVHGAARSAHAVSGLHLVAPIPLARSVVQVAGEPAPRFADPTTLHGPGSHLGRKESAGVRVGLAAVVGATVEATPACPDETLEQALVGSVVVLGWPQDGPDGTPVLMPGAVGPFVAVPRRRPESVLITRVAPLAPDPAADEQLVIPAPDESAFFVLARAALRTHTLRPGDLLTIFPPEPVAVERAPLAGGSWVRVSAPGLGTLSLAVV
jgi:hypothetical protein